MKAAILAVFSEGQDIQQTCLCSTLSHSVISLYPLRTSLYSLLNCAAAASQMYPPSVISCIFTFLFILEVGVKAPDEDTDGKTKAKQKLIRLT